jgi:surface antigen
LVNEVARYVGSGKFTALPGAWCADAVNVWLQATGRPSLGSRMAGAALSYGPRSSGAPGDLVVMATRRSYAGHVGIVAAVRGNEIEIISGNWGHRVARSIILRRQVTAFIRT